MNECLARLLADARVTPRRIWLALLTVFVGLGFSTARAAWDGAVTGKVVQIDTVAEPGNAEFRVYLGGAAMCSTSNPATSGWGWLNSTDTNYRAMVANIMLAYTLGKTVTIYTMKEGGDTCHIHYVVVGG
jgi:hypothetical protein